MSDNINHPSAFNKIKTAIQKATGTYKPTLHIDSVTMMKALSECELFRSFARLHEHQSFSWEWDIREGIVYGITIRLRAEAADQ